MDDYESRTETHMAVPFLWLSDYADASPKISISSWMRHVSISPQGDRGKKIVTLS